MKEKEVESLGCPEEEEEENIEDYIPPGLTLDRHYLSIQKLEKRTCLGKMVKFTFRHVTLDSF